MCVKKDKSQYTGALCYPVAQGIVSDARAGEENFAFCLLFDLCYGLDRSLYGLIAKCHNIGYPILHLGCVNTSVTRFRDLE